MKCVVYSRVSTEEQNPRSQLEVVLRYARDKGFEVDRVFEENISGAVHPLERPVFKEMLEYIRRSGVETVIMYDMTRFYRPPAGRVSESLRILRMLMDEYGILILFAREPEVEDPLLNELWRFLKSWMAAYERLQISMRTKYGLLRLKREGRLYHKPDLAYYYAAWIYNKPLSEVTRDEYNLARRQLRNIIERYWRDKRIKKSRIHEILAENELRELYIRYPKAPKSYPTIYRIMRE